MDDDDKNLVADLWREAEMSDRAARELLGDEFDDLENSDASESLLGGPEYDEPLYDIDGYVKSNHPLGVDWQSHLQRIKRWLRR